MLSLIYTNIKSVQQLTLVCPIIVARSSRTFLISLLIRDDFILSRQSVLSPKIKGWTRIFVLLNKFQCL